MSHPQSYSGDVTLTGDEQSPVEIVSPENVHVLRGAVEGDLEVVNAEFVFTNTPTGGTATIGEVETEISGSLEDGYVVPDGVHGDLRIRDAGDVFIEHGAVGGELQVLGPEKQFRDESAATAPPRDRYDETLTGWQRSASLERPSNGVAVAGGRCSVNLGSVTGDVDVYVTGWQNTVEIEGNGRVSLHLTGSHNTIEVGPYIDLSVATRTGIENTVENAPVPYSELIETTKKEAYPFFGRTKATYQVPAPDQEHCPGCGADAQRVIERRRTDAFFLFRIPVYRYEEGTVHRCEKCSRTVKDVGLSDSERRDLFG